MFVSVQLPSEAFFLKKVLIQYGDYFNSRLVDEAKPFSLFNFFEFNMTASLPNSFLMRSAASCIEAAVNFYFH